MAVATIDLVTPTGAKRYENTALNATISAISSAAGKIYVIVIDNSANAAISYVKLWDLASGSVTVGTTVPDWVIKVPASKRRTYLLLADTDNDFATALSAACVTAGGTGGTTSPVSSVNVQITYA